MLSIVIQSLELISGGYLIGLQENLEVVIFGYRTDGFFIGMSIVGVISMLMVTRLVFKGTVSMVQTIGTVLMLPIGGLLYRIIITEYRKTDWVIEGKILKIRKIWNEEAVTEEINRVFIEKGYEVEEQGTVVMKIVEQANGSIIVAKRLALDVVEKLSVIEANTMRDEKLKQIVSNFIGDSINGVHKILMGSLEGLYAHKGEVLGLLCIGVIASLIMKSGGFGFGGGKLVGSFLKWTGLDNAIGLGKDADIIALESKMDVTLQNVEKAFGNGGVLEVVTKDLLSVTTNLTVVLAKLLDKVENGELNRESVTNAHELMKQLMKILGSTITERNIPKGIKRITDTIEE